MTKVTRQVRVSDQGPTPGLMTCFCVNCKYKGTARGARSLMEVVKDHAVWCALERARAQVLAEQQAAAVM